MKILVSACLLGVACRYDGKSLPSASVLSLLEKHILIPVCPEILGGLPTPRIPAERRGTEVRTREGQDVTAAYRQGAEEALRLARLYGAKAAILKAKSPSCGKGRIYDGNFCGRLVPGVGVTAEKLADMGLAVFTEEEIPAFLAFAEKNT